MAAFSWPVMWTHMCLHVCFWEEALGHLFETTFHHGEVDLSVSQGWPTDVMTGHIAMTTGVQLVSNTNIAMTTGIWLVSNTPTLPWQQKYDWSVTHQHCHDNRNMIGQQQNTINSTSNKTAMTTTDWQVTHNTCYNRRHAYVAVSDTNWIFRCVFRVHHRVWCAIALNFR